ncbi:hypothetical protein NMG60_11029376 [Bertholletia excelsa]
MYFLHTKCSEMPQQITHPCDPSHTGSGFSYHCKICAIDLHIRCAEMPMSIAHHAHHPHLNLVFAPPYHDQGFSCNLCGNTGSKHWLYRCHSCNFDAHLECAIGAESAPAQPGRVEQYPTAFTGSSLVQQARVHQFQTTSAPPVQAQVQTYETTPAPPVQYAVRAPPWVFGSGTPGQNYGWYRPPNNMVNTVETGDFGSGMPSQNYGHYRPPNNKVNTWNPGVFGSSTPVQSGGVPNNMVNNPGKPGRNNGLMGQVIGSLVSGFAEAAGQQLFQGLVGGGSGGGGGGGDGGGGGGDGNSYVGVYSGGDVSGMDSSQDYSTYR